MIGLNLSGFSNVEEEYRRKVDSKVLCSQENREGPPRDGAHCTLHMPLQPNVTLMSGSSDRDPARRIVHLAYVSPAPSVL